MTDGDRTFPPPAGQLLARVTCEACGHGFPLFTFPHVASLAGPVGSVTAAVPDRARACPACGASVANEVAG